MQRFVLPLLMVFVMAPMIKAFEWPLEEELPAHKYFTFSERYMFADGAGPILLEQGDAYINVDLTVDTYFLHNQTLDIGFAIFAAEDGHEEDEFEGLCDSSIARMQKNQFAHNVETVRFRSVYKDRNFIKSDSLGLEGSYYHRSVPIHYQYKVRAEAWHNVVFLLCTDDEYFASQPYMYNARTSASTTDTSTTDSPSRTAAADQVDNLIAQEPNVLQRQQQQERIGFSTVRSGSSSGASSSTGKLWSLLGAENNNNWLPRRLTAAVDAFHAYAAELQEHLTQQIRHKFSQSRLSGASKIINIKDISSARHHSSSGSSSSSSSVKQGDTNGRQLLKAYEPVASLTGRITFRNPYGYLPAEMYGMLPCEASRVIAYCLFSFFYLYYYCKNRESVTALHHAFLAVFIFALIESTVWFAAYQHLNITGDRYCCPFPPVVVTALLLQVFRQTFARTLLLVVSLGYGVVRPKLLTVEWVAIAVVTTLYLGTAIVAQVEDIVILDKHHTGGADDAEQGTGGADSTLALQYRLPGILMDVVFLTWIYLAISSTIRILKEFKQEVKLKMYKQLVTTIGVFVALFAVMTVIYLLDAMQLLDWPWQLAWVQQAIWETLNFAVLASVCLICLPTETSRFLAYTSQLPQDDPDDMLDAATHGLPGRDDFHSGGDGSSRFYDNTGDLNDDYDIELVGSKFRDRGTGGGGGFSALNGYDGYGARSRPHARGNGSNGSSSGGFDVLPTADDEEFGLDREDD